MLAIKQYDTVKKQTPVHQYINMGFIPKTTLATIYF